MDNSAWYAPKLVTTPKDNLIEDIESYLGKDILNKYNKLLKYKDNKNALKILNSINFIVERLEFIHQLVQLEKIVSRLDKPIYEKVNSVETEYSRIEIDNIDFNGFSYDLNALVYYLYNTCFDSVAQLKKSEYRDFKDYLFHKLDESKEYPNGSIKSVVENIINEYKKEHGDGLRKDFIATIQSIDDDIKEELLNNVMIFNFSKNTFLTQKFNNVEDFKKSNQQYDRKYMENNWNTFYKEQLQNWNSQDEHNRLRKIADKLYAIRSKYTHNSIRSFLPTDNRLDDKLNDACIFLFLKEQEHLICKQNCNFLDLLKKILINACNIKLDNLIKENNWY